MAVQTAERISHVEVSDNVIFQRSLFAYQEAAKLISGTVLEIGAGMGYGIKYLLPFATSYIAIDKYRSHTVAEAADSGKIRFFLSVVPPLKDIPDNSVDFIVTFQVIEHIRNDDFFLNEIYRVLKPGGKLILTTPNIRMSLTRNPWHVREYTKEEMLKLLSGIFSRVNLSGVYGREKPMAYYEKNRESVRKITRFDIFRMQYRIPRFILKIPYDLLNRRNRRKLLKNTGSVTTDITTDDYYLEAADDGCFDFFAVAVK